MKVLAASVGSTALKLKLFEMPEETALCAAKSERVGSLEKTIFAYGSLVTGKHYRLEGQCIPDHTTGIRMFLDAHALYCDNASPYDPQCSCRQFGTFEIQKELARDNPKIAAKNRAFARIDQDRKFSARHYAKYVSQSNLFGQRCR